MIQSIAYWHLNSWSPVDIYSFHEFIFTVFITKQNSISILKYRRGWPVSLPLSWCRSLSYRNQSIDSLTCFADQWNGFFMIGTSVMKKLFCLTGNFVEFWPVSLRKFCVILTRLIKEILCNRKALYMHALIFIFHIYACFIHAFYWKWTLFSENYVTQWLSHASLIFTILLNTLIWHVVICILLFCNYVAFPVVVSY